MFKNYLKQGFSDVWGMLWDIPGPEQRKAVKLDQEQLNRYILMLFPVFGLIAGIFTLVLAWLCGRLPGVTAASIIFAISTVILHEILTGGRNLSSLSSWFDALSQRQKPIPALLTMNENIHAVRGTVGLLALFAIIGLRAVCLAFLFSASHWSWLPVAFILAYGLQGHLATLPSLSHGKEIIHADDHQIWMMWLASGAACVVIGKGYFMPVLAATLLTCLASAALKKFFFLRVDGITGNIIGAMSYAAETLLLLFGVAFLSA